MVRCFLTGVQFPLEDAFVLNRREARGLVAALNDRVASLRRLVEQLAPLDGEASDASAQQGRQEGRARKKHRLVCKTVASAIAAGFPEVPLFTPWPEYQSQLNLAALTSLRGHVVSGSAIKKLSDDTLRKAEKLARNVLRELDPSRALPHSTKLAISVAICLHHRSKAPANLVDLIRSAATGSRKQAVAGIAADDLQALRLVLGVPSTTVELAGTVGTTLAEPSVTRNESH